MTEVPANMPGVIRVMAGIQPLLTTEKATVLEFYDGFGDLMALFFRHFNNNMWVFVNKADPDWESHLVRLGYIQPSLSATELVRSIATKG